MRPYVRSKIWSCSRHPAYTRSLPSVHSLSGFAGPKEYNHDTNFTGSLADTPLFAGHRRPGHLADSEPDREELRATVCAAIRAAFRAGVGCAVPVYHVVSVGSRLADLFPGGSGSHRGGAGVGGDSDEAAARHCGATAIRRLPDPIWSHLAKHFCPQPRTGTRHLAEMALSRGTVVGTPRDPGSRGHLSTTTGARAPVCWGVLSSTTCDAAPGCSHWQSRSSPRKSGWPAASTGLHVCMWIRF